MRNHSDKLSHINALLANFFFGFLKGLFERGNIYVGLPPKYRYQYKSGKSTYIQNDKELEYFEFTQVKNNVDILNEDNVDLREIINKKNEYVTIFNNVLYQYSISRNLLSRFLIPDEGDEYLEDIIESVGLEYNEGHITGLYDEEWHDFFENEIFNEIDRIVNVLDPAEKIRFTFEKEEMEMYPIDFYMFIDKKYQFKYDYFKGKPLPLI